jgi:hypothetical protein
MQQSIRLNRVTLGTLLVALASGCVAHVSEPNLARSEADQRIPVGNRETEPGESAPGIIVHIDPRSGEFTSQPAEALPAQKGQQSVEKAREPALELHETLSPVPGGGVAIRLGESFFTPLTATIDADGKLRLEHVPTLPDSPDKK